MYVPFLHLFGENIHVHPGFGKKKTVLTRRECSFKRFYLSPPDGRLRVTLFYALCYIYVIYFSKQFPTHQVEEVALTLAALVAVAVIYFEYRNFPYSSFF